MSEVKGTLLTVILALSVFGVVFGMIVSAIEFKAGDVSKKIEEAGQPAAQGAAAAAGVNALTYTY